MAVAKVILNGNTLIDVTQKTVEANKLLNGYTALKNDGTDITGEYVPSTAVLQTKSATYTPTTSAQTDTITPDVGYDGMDEVDITINAVATGTAGTPTASKGTVSSNSIAVTPSVTNVTGYITGGTKTGTAVTVSASELVSGTKTVSASGTADVTNYASISVPSGTAGTPSATKGVVSSNSVSVTPSVTNTTGWITGSTINGTAVTVSASELVSGTKSISISASGTTTENVTNYASASISVPSGSASTPATTITANPTISVSSSGLITASVSGSQSITPTVSAGYVSSGTAGTVSVSGSNTSQLTAQSAQTLYPSTTDQTITSGKYLTGTQTFKGVVLTNLIADNIADGVTVMVGDADDADRIASITGTHSGGGSSVTTVTFEDDALFGAGPGGKVVYVDGNGTTQVQSGMLAEFSACSYQMMSGSALVMFGDLVEGGVQYMGTYTGLSYVNGGNMPVVTSRGSGTLTWAVFQVD